MDLEAFVETYAERVRRRSFRTDRLDDERLRVEHPDGRVAVVNLHNLWREVKHAASQGPTSLTGAIDKRVDLLFVEDTVSADGLRMVVRLASDVGDIGVLGERIGPLVALLVFDQGVMLRWARVDDLDGLGLTVEEAFELARKGTWDEIEPYFQVHGANPYLVTCGGNYETSCLLLEPALTRIVAHVGESLVVAAPARDLLFVTTDGNPVALTRLAELAEDPAKKDLPYLLTPQRFMRTEAGWRPYELPPWVDIGVGLVPHHLVPERVSRIEWAPGLSMVLCIEQDDGLTMLDREALDQRGLEATKELFDQAWAEVLAVAELTSAGGVPLRSFPSMPFGWSILINPHFLRPLADLTDGELLLCLSEPGVVKMCGSAEPDGVEAMNVAARAPAPGGTAQRYRFTEDGPEPWPSLLPCCDKCREPLHSEWARCIQCGEPAQDLAFIRWIFGSAIAALSVLAGMWAMGGLKAPVSTSFGLFFPIVLCGWVARRWWLGLTAEIAYEPLRGNAWVLYCGVMVLLSVYKLPHVVQVLRGDFVTEELSSQLGWGIHGVLPVMLALAIGEIIVGYGPRGLFSRPPVVSRGRSVNLG
jgi:hypothetical protein